MNKAPLVFSVKGNSLDDGPGIRSVIFFKGCPLNCVWCHNPESKSPDPELSFDAQKCVACDTCIQTCKEGALSRDNPFFVDRAKCTLCFECAKNCPSGALSRVGEEWTIDKLVAKVVRDKPFYDTSGGGVTFSGGEPTLNLAFLAELIAAIKAQGIQTLVETSGLFDLDRFAAAVLPHTDTIYMDIKLLDAGEHKHYCGVDNQRVLENFARLHEMSRSGRFEIIPRVPLIPGITDRKENLEAIAAFLREHGANQIRLLPNNPTWHQKCLTIGTESAFGQDSPMRQWLPQEKLEQCRNIFLAQSFLLDPDPDRPNR
jgi:pyruvate formate lyase activating enzyme